MAGMPSECAAERDRPGEWILVEDRCLAVTVTRFLAVLG
jgi:hypothetical protein